MFLFAEFERVSSLNIAYKCPTTKRGSFHILHVIIKSHTKYTYMKRHRWDMDERWKPQKKKKYVRLTVSPMISCVETNDKRFWQKKKKNIYIFASKLKPRQKVEQFPHLILAGS